MGDTGSGGQGSAHLEAARHVAGDAEDQGSADRGEHRLPQGRARARARVKVRVRDRVRARARVRVSPPSTGEPHCSRSRSPGEG